MVPDTLYWIEKLIFIQVTDVLIISSSLYDDIGISEHMKSGIGLS